MATDAEGHSVSDSRSLDVVTSNVTVLRVSVSPDDCPSNYLGQTQTLALNADGTQTSCANPAKLGSVVTIFVDGLGITAVGATTGSLNPSSPDPLPNDVVFSSENGALPPVFVSATPFAGAVSGLYRMQIQLPNSARNGLVEATLGIGATFSGPGAYVSIPIVP